MDLSIVIPTFNRSKYLKVAIESALAQTVDCDIVVVDHGSTDGTPELVSSFGDRILYVRRDVDDGPCIAWFDGILRSRAKYIHLTFDDDWIAPNFAACTIPLMNDDTAVAFTNAKVVAGDNEFVLFDPMIFKAGKHPSSTLTNFLMNARQAISPGCAVFHREDALAALMANPVFAFNRYHGAGPDLMMFLVPLSQRPNYVFVDECLSFFRSHPESITIDAFSDKKKEQRLCDAYSEYKMMFLAEHIASTFGRSQITKAAGLLWRHTPRILSLQKSLLGRLFRGGGRVQKVK